MAITLQAGGSQVAIDPQGAWLLDWTIQGEPILFPKVTLTNAMGDAKLRGGCHVCLPNFGPGGNSGQPQHGFGREMAWRVVEQTESRAVLELPRGSEGYEVMTSQLTYELADNKLSMGLALRNAGNVPLWVAPGFHPYFITRAADIELAVNDKAYKLDELTDARFIEAEKVTVTIGQQRLRMGAENLHTWAIWTDRLGDYVCVEPTVAGFSFENEQPSPLEILEPGGRTNYGLVIERLPAV